MPKPNVIPWTTPKPSDTAATPAIAPVATGNMPNRTAGTDRYTVSSRMTISAELKMDRRTAASSIWRLAATANTPGPLMRKRSAAAGGGGRARSKAARIAAIARAWPSVSDPAARVRATMSAREPSAEAQTPSTVLGPGRRSN